MAPNTFTLAADNSPHLLPILRANPSLASAQDDHGYSLVHAAASYNHLDLLQTLVHEFHVDPNIRDEDGETALFVVESVEPAQCLLEELGADLTLKNEEGMTAEEKIRAEGEYPTIADFLRESRVIGTPAVGDTQSTQNGSHPPPLPPNVKVHLGTMEDPQAIGEGTEADPEFRRRIEELAARDDFQGEEGQKQLRDLIKDAIRGAGREDERQVRPRLE
ncbi:hypothetical protein HO133_002589 [Letharia lupina]|uniref:Ankyrin repeat protein n=1 Tax=Letharia lupina TaxID=560253 RepID=A0A8H6FAR6_9LECA|nr:uncharacterized protein HO133_002589 [Letharia lupina]KAF6220909.1 hypothetical protein HO133_002589 [Letharia lupina]